MMERQLQALRDAGYFVGKRDPNRNRAFKGEYMVCEDVAYPLPTDDASEGGYCIVGDSPSKLIADAVEHLGLKF